MVTKKKPALGKCCPVMELVLSRPVPMRRPAVGLEFAPWISGSGKGTGVSIILHFPKSKNRSEEHTNATYAELSFCPFCGVKLVREK